MNFLKEPKIGIVGLGFVGGAIKDAMVDRCTLVLVDKDPKKGPSTFQDLKDCDGVFVAVPTPFGDDGRCDTSALEYVLEQLKAIQYDGVIISKCTAPPLTYKALNQGTPNLVHAPEFLTAANAYSDYVRGKFIIIGGRIKAYREQAERIIKLGQTEAENIAHCTIEEASLAKYTINSFLATKVTFMNEIHQLSTLLGADYNQIAQMVSMDNRIGISHMRVPGPDGEFGFGGMCFPKDTSALLKFASDVGAHMNVLDAAVKKNTLLRLTEPK